MDEFTEQAKNLLSKRAKEIREDYKNMFDTEKKAQIETLSRILFSLPDEDREWLDRRMSDDLLQTYEECEALYLAGLKDGLRLLRLLSM